MKNLVFGLGAIILFIFNVNAQEKQDLDQIGEFKWGSIIISFNEEIVEYKFKSINQLSEEIEEVIKEIDFNSLQSVKETCGVKMEVKVEIYIGVTKIVISEIISTNCTNEALIGVSKRLKAVLLAAIG